MKRINVTMKIYPVKERQDGEHWSESQKRRMITIRLMNGNEKPDQATANIYYQKLLKLGYAALDYNTHTKIVGVEDLHEEQFRLNTLFNITLTNGSSGKKTKS